MKTRLLIIVEEIFYISKKFVAFTLAELLITITTVGVVATLTLPNLYNSMRAKELEAKFKKMDSAISQFSRYIQLNDENYYDSNTISKRNLIMKYFSGAIDCGAWNNFNNVKGCYNSQSSKFNHYKSYTNSTYAYKDWIDDGTFLLKDGTLIFLDGPSKRMLSVDLNGYYKGPNRWGYDIFMWDLKDSDFVPMGKSGTYISSFYCSQTPLSVNEDKNGMGCAIFAKNDSDYFKKLKW